MRYRVTAFGTVFFSPTLMGALVLVSAFRVQYGPAVRITMTRFQEGVR